MILHKGKGIWHLHQKQILCRCLQPQTHLQQLLPWSCHKTLPMLAHTMPKWTCMEAYCGCSCQCKDYKPTTHCIAKVATPCCKVSLQSYKLQFQIRNSLPCFAVAHGFLFSLEGENFQMCSGSAWTLRCWSNTTQCFGSTSAFWLIEVFVLSKNIFLIQSWVHFKTS